MWRKIVNLSNFHRYSLLSTRTYLSDAYKLTTEWSQRLDTDILRPIKVENFYVDLEMKFNQQKKLSAVDVDILTNKISDYQHHDEMVDIVAKLRRTEEAHKLFDSTQHALVRNFTDGNNLDFLVSVVLNNRESYGVFLDDYTAPLVLDRLIREKNFKLAARAATIWALQEDFSSRMTVNMALFSCYKFLETLEEFDDLKPPPVEEPVEGAPKKKKKDEIKIRVKYLKNEFYDDHFDIKKTNHLMGKTFLYLADQLSDEALKNSFKLLGYAIYEKFDSGNEFLTKSSNSAFYKEIVDRVKQFATNIDENEPAKQFYESVDKLSSLKSDPVEPIIEKLVQDSVKTDENAIIEQQKKLYADWIAERDDKLKKEIIRAERIQRLLEVEKMQDKLESEEKKLWYFENEEQVNLEIDKVQNVLYPRKWFGKRKKLRVVEERYIPPDVDVRRNATVGKPRK